MGRYQLLCARAIGKSKLGSSLCTVAGAKLMVIFPRGRRSALLLSALRTRSLLSETKEPRQSPRLCSFLLRNSDVSKDTDAREKCVNDACCQCGYSDEIGNGIDPINALKPLCRHFQIMDRTDLGQKTAQRLNMDRADSLLGLEKLFGAFTGHFD